MLYLYVYIFNFYIPSSFVCIPHVRGDGCTIDRVYVCVCVCVCVCVHLLT